jgi:hypothetical protein
MRQLPILAAFGHSLRSTFDNIGFAFHISWPWMLLLLPISIVGNIYIFLNAPAVQPRSFAEFPFEIIVVTVLMAVCAMIAFASIAVAWHRYILLDQVPVGMQRLRLDGTVWRYVGNTILITLFSGLIGIPFGLAIGVVSMLVGYASPALAGVIAVILFLALAFYLVSFSIRLGIKLPAIALERRDFSLKDARDVSRTNRWRIGCLMVLVFLCLVLVSLVFAAFSYAFGQAQSSTAVATLVIVQMAVNWAATIWNVTLLTSLYGFFVEQREF